MFSFVILHVESSVKPLICLAFLKFPYFSADKKKKKEKNYAKTNFHVQLICTVKTLHLAMRKFLIWKHCITSGNVWLYSEFIVIETLLITAVLITLSLSLCAYVCLCCLLKERKMGSCSVEMNTKYCDFIFNLMNNRRKCARTHSVI